MAVPATAAGTGQRKPTSDGQVISELSFGFRRFLLARRYQGQLWPDLATGFPHTPSRRRQLVEDPVVRLHEFRNRLAHHQRVVSEPEREICAAAVPGGPPTSRRRAAARAPRLRSRAAGAATDELRPRFAS